MFRCMNLKSCWGFVSHPCRTVSLFLIFNIKHECRFQIKALMLSNVGYFYSVQLDYLYYPLRNTLSNGVYIMFSFEGVERVFPFGLSLPENYLKSTLRTGRLVTWMLLSRTTPQPQLWVSRRGRYNEFILRTRLRRGPRNTNWIDYGNKDGEREIQNERKSRLLIV